MTKLIERWAVIKEFPNYSISTNGKVLNNKSLKILKGFKCYRKNLNPVTIKVSIRSIKAYTRSVHTLMKVFMPPRPSKKHTIDHIDRNPFNNNIDNLRWATVKEQNKNKNRRNEFHKISMGELEVIFNRSKNETLATISKDYRMQTSSLHSLLRYMHPEY